MLDPLLAYSLVWVLIDAEFQISMIEVCNLVGRLTMYSSAGQVHTYFARYYLTVVEPIGLDEMLLHVCDYHDS